jgi:hypothetical protein
MSFSFGASAIESLRIWPQYIEPAEGEEYVYDPTWTISPFEWPWFFESMLPAFVLLVIAALGIYLSITERNSSPVLKAKKKATTSRPAKKPTPKKSFPKPISARKSSAPRKR